ncbi:hypothetical protein EVAR_18615_1 [Eumeta japonica]|uniref:Uncharacterized protein n=1 Tax=Eumeta variegata TaxID=151549 RepID=A0A4C1V550_EUMVA|nr:hypothetical protein EVAR_18615_1 [Eumeta japonica]
MKLFLYGSSTLIDRGIEPRTCVLGTVEDYRHRDNVRDRQLKAFRSVWFTRSEDETSFLNSAVVRVAPGTSRNDSLLVTALRHDIRRCQQFCTCIGHSITAQRTKLCRSELPMNDVLRRHNSPRPFLLLPRFSILRHCDAFVTNFTAAEFHPMCCTCRCSRLVLSLYPA